VLSVATLAHLYSDCFWEANHTAAIGFDKLMSRDSVQQDTYFHGYFFADRVPAIE
jgi:hypothetical protein